jgi:hypothetical protein
VLQAQDKKYSTASTTSRDASGNAVDATSFARRQQTIDDRQLVSGLRQSMSYGARNSAIALMSREVNVPREGFCETVDKTMDRLAETSKTIVHSKYYQSVLPHLLVCLS